MVSQPISCITNKECSENQLTIYQRHLKKKISHQVILDKRKTELLRRKKASSDISYLVDIWSIDI